MGILNKPQTRNHFTQDEKIQIIHEHVYALSLNEIGEIASLIDYLTFDQLKAFAKAATIISKGKEIK